MVIVVYDGIEHELILEYDDFFVLRGLCADLNGTNLKNNRFIFTEPSDAVWKFISGYIQQPVTEHDNKRQETDLNYIESMQCPVKDDDLAIYYTDEMKKEDDELAKMSAHALQTEFSEGHIIHDTPEKEKQIAYSFRIDNLNNYIKDFGERIESDCQAILDLSGSNMSIEDFDKKYHKFFGKIVRMMIEREFIDKVMLDGLPVEYRYGKKIIKKIKKAIDEETYNGGISKSMIRRRVGRNHQRYIQQIDDILNHLLSEPVPETRKPRYRLEKGKYLRVIVSNIGNSNILQPKAIRKVGRPRKKRPTQDIRVKDISKEFSNSF